MKRNNINKNQFDGSTKDYLMRNNGFSVGFNMPNALSGEKTFTLPPYTKRMSYLVDKYPACPKEWLRSEGIIKSFFVPVISGKGMWLDFNENENHTHHVAIVISIQGVNPITGMPCKDAQLEQYIEECPKHKIKFGPDRYCSKCNYKWPKQNYITTTATPRGQLWLDGFRTVEGIVRQYILTEEKMKGVASNIIGKDRVYAIGLSFFVSKEKKPVRADDNILRGTTSGIIYGQHQFFSPVHTAINWQIPTNTYTTCDGNLNDDLSETNITKTPGTESLYCCSTSAVNESSSIPSSITKKYAENSHGNLYKKSSRTRLSSVSSIQTKKLEVGAGANINQLVYDDPERLDFWHDKPESIICVNYVDEESCFKILNEGEINMEGHKEGYLKEIPVGN